MTRHLMNGPKSKKGITMSIDHHIANAKVNVKDAEHAAETATDIGYSLSGIIHGLVAIANVGLVIHETMREGLDEIRNEIRASREK